MADRSSQKVLYPSLEGDTAFQTHDLFVMNLLGCPNADDWPGHKVPEALAQKGTLHLDDSIDSND